MKVQLQYWTIKGPGDIFLCEQPGPKYLVILIMNRDKTVISGRYLEELNTALVTGRVHKSDDKSELIGLTEEQQKWLKDVAPIASQVIHVTVKETKCAL